MTKISSNYVILWGSQGGNAEWIAKNIHTEATKKGYNGQCLVMDDHEQVKKTRTYSIKNQHPPKKGFA